MDYDTLINISVEEQAQRYRDMVTATFCHISGEDLLARIHPRRLIDIKRRVDGVETWYEGDWLTTLMDIRDGKRSIGKSHYFRTRESDNG